jgi:uncharacterized protein YdbL (DUF1318 family)
MMKQTQNSTFRVLLLATGLLISTFAFAIELDAAKKQGLVGERADGYLGVVVDNPSAEVVALVKDVNDKRRKAYQQIAQKNGIDIADVEARAGQVAIEKTPPGGWIFLSRWEKKP